MSVSLGELYANCEQVGDCMEWQGRTRDGVFPQLWDNASRKWLSVRRLVVQLSRDGRPLPTRMRCSMRCENDACIAEGHILVRSMSQMMKAVVRAGRHMTSAQRAAIIKGARSRSTVKLTLEQARAIRASELSSREAAIEYGVHSSMIRMIRRNEYWREDPVPGASIFALAASQAATPTRGTK